MKLFGKELPIPEPQVLLWWARFPLIALGITIALRYIVELLK
jgi:hypothetical protein